MKVWNNPWRVWNWRKEGAFHPFVPNLNLCIDDCRSKNGPNLPVFSALPPVHYSDLKDSTRYELCWENNRIKRVYFSAVCTCSGLLNIHSRRWSPGQSVQVLIDLLLFYKSIQKLFLILTRHKALEEVWLSLFKALEYCSVTVNEILIS